MITPKFLHEGSRVALLAPSGPLPEGRLDEAVAAVEKYGLKPVVYPSCKQTHGYFAGMDQQRAADFNAAYADKSIEGILCARGGYGAQRLYKLIDWKTVFANPKPLFGYSDITFFHLILGCYADTVSYHTPMPSTEWYKGLDEYTDQYLKLALFGGKWGELPNCDKEKRVTVVGGKAQGKLIGGNLSLVSSAVGTPFAPVAKDCIMFLEDIGEAPYRLDGMLNHMVQAGSFDGCRGIILGYYTDCKGKDGSLSIPQVFEEVLAPLNIPILSGVTCGHDLPTLSLPLGMDCALDADKKTITILQ